MTTKTRFRLQVGESTFGRMNHARLNLIGALDLLNDAMEKLANGECVGGKHAVEAAHNQIEDSGREELAMIASLADFEPVWRIDGALHQRRKEFLNARAKELVATATWTEDAFEMTWDTNFIRVDGKDNWVGTSGTSDCWICNVGLTSLYAHLHCEQLPESVSRLSKWLQDGRSSR
ncbi:hypothetical protein [Phyllobacterium myrsinacearum]|uniref:Uncharacterized protein n=1 Tax=Phyllobacterium myrsinacearum TaxID=28101 RepID=A0A839EHN0_9HYPH|nr:hypothetical protein [Phyllobacterium myrsinacearum]MBA8877868.1 hypothetical protein [Phyllobacterium myrsinacearum]